MLGNHPLGHVAHLWRYPIKSLAAEPLERSEVLASGFARDRESALLVATPNRPRSGKSYRGKEHPRLHTVDSEAAAIELARAKGIELERDDAGPHFDLDPVSILLDTWLAEIERSLDRALDPLRFRPNIFVRAASDFASAEAALVGRTVRVGSVRLRISSPIHRCVVPAYDVATGASDREILAYLFRERQNEMGVYAHVVTPGSMALGDVLELES